MSAAGNNPSDFDPQLWDILNDAFATKLGISGDLLADSSIISFLDEDYDEDCDDDDESESSQVQEQQQRISTPKQQKEKPKRSSQR